MRALVVRLALGLLASGCLVVRPEPVDAPALAGLATPSGKSTRAVVLVAAQGPRSATLGGNPPVDFLHTHGLEVRDTTPLLEVLDASGLFAQVALGADDTPAPDLRLEARYWVQETMDQDLLWLGYLTMTLFPVRAEVVLTLDLTLADARGALGTVSRAERVVVWENWLLLPFGLLGQPLKKVQRVRADLLRSALSEARLRGWI